MDDEVKKNWAKALTRDFEPEVDIYTPTGLYRTSVSLAQKLDEFYKETEKRYTGAIGGQYTYSFTSTSLGIVLKIKDGMSGREFDATNYESW